MEGPVIVSCISAAFPVMPANLLLWFIMTPPEKQLQRASS
jgi:hypothetical protein